MSASIGLDGALWVVLEDCNIQGTGHKYEFRDQGVALVAARRYDTDHPFLARCIALQSNACAPPGERSSSC